MYRCKQRQSLLRLSRRRTWQANVRAEKNVLRTTPTAELRPEHQSQLDNGVVPKMQED